MSYALGIDPSIRGTGIATRYRCHRINVTHIQVDGRELHTLLRRRHIRSVVTDRWLTGIRVAAVEGMYPKMQSGQHDRAALLGDIVDVLDSHGIAIVIVPPKVLKKYATGNGNADKDAMIRAALVYQLGAPANGDEADALWLCALAYQLCGDPLVNVPSAQVDALKILTSDSWVRGRPNALDRRQP